MQFTDCSGKIIAIITNDADDVYCFRKELIESLIGKGFKILISCPNGDKMELMKGIDFIYDDVYIDRRGTSVKKDLALYSHYKELFKTYRPSVVLTYTVKPNIYASIAAEKLGIPVINNVTGLGSILKKKGFVKKLVMFLFKRAFKKSACVMFQNAENMRLAKEKNLLNGKGRLLPGSGVNCDRYPLLPYPDGKDGVSGASVVFNYIGRVLKDKNVDDYIAAAKIIRQRYPATEFNMLGFIEPRETHYGKLLEDLGKEGIVNYLGNQRDVKPFVERSHATIHPSTYGEGMSNALLESASMGRVLITTDNPGCKEAVIDGITGYIYKGGDVAALVKNIERFLATDNAERKLMGEKGREFVKENFSREFVISAYEEEIDAIFSCGRG